MAKSSYNLKHSDMPMGNFRFAVEIDGIYEGGFARASGMASEVEVEEYREGGVNHFTHRLPVRVVNYNVVLEKGLTKSKELYKWYSQVKEGIIKKKDFSIMLLDTNGKVIRRWNFRNGYPIKWEASELDALDSSIVMEKIELVHEGMTENN